MTCSRSTRRQPPRQTAGDLAHVGTTLFNMAVNPASGKVYVTNTEAHNDVRFEGHDPGSRSVRGHIADSRISVIDPASGRGHARQPEPARRLRTMARRRRSALSVAFPQDLAFSRDGSTLYVVAQGSAKLAIYDTRATRGRDRGAELVEPGDAAAAAARRASCSTRRRSRAYVLTRFDNSISIVNLRPQAEVGKRRDVQPRAGERHRRAASISTTRTSRRSTATHGVRELPYRRRQGRARVGPRQSGRRAAADHAARDERRRSTSSRSTRAIISASAPVGSRRSLPRTSRSRAR